MRAFGSGGEHQIRERIIRGAPCYPGSLEVPHREADDSSYTPGRPGRETAKRLRLDNTPGQDNGNAALRPDRRRCNAATQQEGSRVRGRVRPVPRVLAPPAVRPAVPGADPVSAKSATTQADRGEVISSADLADPGWSVQWRWLHATNRHGRSRCDFGSATGSGTPAHELGTPWACPSYAEASTTAEKPRNADGPGATPFLERASDGLRPAMFCDESTLPADDPYS